MRCLAWFWRFRLFAKFVDHIAPLRGSGLEAMLKDAYEFLRDMSLLIATGGVAYITNVYQKRSSFLAALEGGMARYHRGQVGAVLLYPAREADAAKFILLPSASCPRRSTTCARSIRTSVRPATWSGLYPYAPLHDMRRALQTLDPRKNPKRPTPRRVPWCAMRSCNRSMPCAKPSWRNSISRNRTIRCSFRADARAKAVGLDGQRAPPARTAAGAPGPRQLADPRIDQLLAELMQKEEQTAKPWRQPAAHARPAQRRQTAARPTGTGSV